MKNLFALLLFNVCFIDLMAQPVIFWQHPLGGSKEEFAKSMLVAPDGDYVIVGHSASSDGNVTWAHGGQDWWVVKVFPFGEINWKIALGGSNDEFEPLIQQAADGGFAICGTSKSLDGNVSGSHGYSDYWVVKLSPQGVLLWEKAFGGSNSDGPISFISTQDGGFLAAGNTTSNDYDATGNHGLIDLLIVKLASDGTTEWTKVLGGSKEDQLNFAMQTSDQGYIIAGQTFSNDGDVSGFHGNGSFSDFWIVKLDSIGNLEWTKTLGGSQTDYPKSILETNDGGYAIAGSSLSTDGDVTSNHGNADYWIVKLSETGELQWQKTFGGSGSDYLQNIQYATDGGYLINGSSTSNDGDVSGNHGCEDSWLLKIDNAGNMLWQKSFGGSNCNDMINSIKPLSNGDYVIAGNTQSVDGDGIGNHGSNDAWVFRMKPNGEVVWKKLLGGSGSDRAFFIEPIESGSYIVGCRTTSNDGDVSGNHGSGDYWPVKLFGDQTNDLEDPGSPQVDGLVVAPNPGSSMVYFKTFMDEPLLDIEITDLMGKLLIHQNLGRGAGLDISLLDNGIYFALAKAPSGKVYAGRLLKAK